MPEEVSSETLTFKIYILSNIRYVLPKHFAVLTLHHKRSFTQIRGFLAIIYDVVTITYMAPGLVTFESMVTITYMVSTFFYFGSNLTYFFRFMKTRKDKLVKIFI